jgi:predicted RNA binding protein YcfA (HicA-like mRNA interferase family)
MKAVSGKRFIRLLVNLGWELKRVNGSHHIFSHPDNMARISVPVHGNKALKLGLQKHIMKIAGITEKDL